MPRTNLSGKKMIQLQQCFFLSLPLSSHLKDSACAGWWNREAGKKSHLALLRLRVRANNGRAEREKHGSQMTAKLTCHPCMPKVTISPYIIKIKFLIHLSQLLSWGGEGLCYSSHVQFFTDNYTLYGTV